MTTTRTHDTVILDGSWPFVLVRDTCSRRVLTVDTKVLSEGVIVRAWRSSDEAEHFRFDLTPQQARALAEVLVAAANDSERRNPDKPSACVAHVPGNSLWDCECDECRRYQRQAEDL